MSADYSGFFPFGWIRCQDGDNWQIYWSGKTGKLYLKATKTDALVKVAEAANWTEAKKKADSLITEPDSVLSMICEN